MNLHPAHPGWTVTLNPERTKYESQQIRSIIAWHDNGTALIPMVVSADNHRVVQVSSVVDQWKINDPHDSGGRDR